MLFSSVSIAVKNAATTALTALPIALTVAVLPASFSVEAFFWGCIGGVCRSVAIFEGWKSVCASLAVGGLSAAGLNGAKLPWVSEYINVEAGNSQLQPFFIGVCGIIIIGTIMDIARVTRAKFGWKP